MTSSLLTTVLLLQVGVTAMYLMSEFGARIRHRRRLAEMRIAREFRRSVVNSLVADRIEPGIDQLAAASPRRCDDVLSDVLRPVRSGRNPVVVELATATGFVRRAAEDLRSSRWWKRRAALHRLIVVGGTTPDMASLIGDTSPEVRAAAVHHMVISEAGGAAGGTAVSLLDDRSPLVRQAAREAIVRLGSDAVPALRRVLAEPRSNEQLLSVLPLIGYSGDASLLRLSRSYLDRSEPEVVAAGVRAIGSRATADDVAPFARLLRSGNPTIQLAVIEAATASALWQLSAAVASCLSASDPAVADAAAAGLGSLGDSGRLLVSRLARTG